MNKKLKRVLSTIGAISCMGALLFGIPSGINHNYIGLIISIFFAIFGIILIAITVD